MTDTQVTWLTQESHDRLKSELDSLIANRPVIAAEINERREEGDLKENGGYHAAKEEQGKMEARIRQLESLLRDAVVGEAPKDNGIVDSGMVVTVEMFGDTETFLLGSREIAGDVDIDVYSEQSPLGEAIMGKKVGEETSYDAPNGKTIEVKIVDAKPYAG